MRFNHNYLRMWSREVGENDWYYGSAPSVRTGAGTALDVKPKFGLKQFNPEYFERPPRIGWGGQPFKGPFEGDAVLYLKAP